jgi:hypothetical protein
MTNHLDIPPWAPAIIHDRARELYHRAVDNHQDLPAAMIKRLICDNRMQTVWVELLREGDRACLDLFCNAVALMQHPIINQPYPSYIDLASRLRNDAGKVSRRSPRKTFSRLASSLRKAAAAYDTLAKAELPRDEVKRAVRDLSCFLSERFGPAHYRTAATICSVALDRKISPDDVRNWLRADGVRAAKKD